jgi:AraC family transcriptional regulator
MINRQLYSDETGNAIWYSAVREWQGSIHFKGVAAKYVISGAEIYEVNGRGIRVNGNQYVLGNDNSRADVIIQSPQEVHGICVDISEALIREVAEAKGVSSDFIHYLCEEQLLVNRYNDRNNTLGRILQSLATSIHLMDSSDFTPDSFFAMAEAVVEDQSIIFGMHEKLMFKRQLTKQDVIRSLIDAKEFIDTQFHQPLNIDQIAAKAGISRYHFSRLFKDVFGHSPYSYYNQKRLLAACQMLRLEGNISDVAAEVGFADLAAFSKAFTKRFGMGPTEFRKARFDK